MKTISLHDLIIELKKKKINLGSDPKATVSMYSEMGIIPPPKITARPDSDLEPEVSYPVDTIDKINNTNLEKLPVVSKSLRIGACISNPQKFIGIGLNYSDHAKETGVAPPNEPILFIKAIWSILSLQSQTVVYPKLHDNGKY